MGAYFFVWSRNPFAGGLKIFPGLSHSAVSFRVWDEKGVRKMKVKREPQRTPEFMERAVRTFAGAVYRLALVHTQNRADAEDVLQETFLRLYLDATCFADDAHLKAWLLRVALHRCRDLHRSAWARHRAELTENLPAFSSPEESGLWESVARLPPKYREVIHLHYQEGYSTDEVAKLLGRKPATVRTQLCRARALLKQDLGGNDDDEQVSEDVRSDCAGSAHFEKNHSTV